MIKRNVFVDMLPYGWCMACGGFEALSCPAKPNLAMERKPFW